MFHVPHTYSTIWMLIFSRRTCRPMQPCNRNWSNNNIIKMLSIHWHRWSTSIRDSTTVNSHQTTIIVDRHSHQCPKTSRRQVKQCRRSISMAEKVNNTQRRRRSRQGFCRLAWTTMRQRRPVLGAGWPKRPVCPSSWTLHVDATTTKRTTSDRRTLMRSWLDRYTDGCFNF